MGDWLGTGFIATHLRKYRRFSLARSYARTLSLKSFNDWKENKHLLPSDIPVAPNIVYVGSGWLSWGDWLGTSSVAPGLRKFRSFDLARAFARSLGLRNNQEWRLFCKGKLKTKGTLPPDIPSAPARTYDSKGWKGFGDWLGTRSVGIGQYRPFSEARDFVRTLGLKNSDEWKAFSKGELNGKVKRPLDIPSAPARTYAEKGWVGMGDWLGTGSLTPGSKTYRSFIKARAFARKLNLKSRKEWHLFCKEMLRELGKLPHDIPAYPDEYYADKGWLSFGDWLGTGYVANIYRTYRSFEDSRSFVHKLKLSGKSQWEAYCTGKMRWKGTKPLDIPFNPQTFYKNKGWKGMGDWLGTGRKAAKSFKFRSFVRARAFVRRLKLQTLTEWQEYSVGRLPTKGMRPSDIPALPPQVYKDKGWSGYGDWLGTGRTRKTRAKF